MPSRDNEGYGGWQPDDYRMRSSRNSSGTPESRAPSPYRGAYPVVTGQFDAAPSYPAMTATAGPPDTYYGDWRNGVPYTTAGVPTASQDIAEYRQRMNDRADRAADMLQNWGPDNTYADPRNRNTATRATQQNRSSQDVQSRPAPRSRPRPTPRDIHGNPIQSPVPAHTLGTRQQEGPAHHNTPIFASPEPPSRTSSRTSSSRSPSPMTAGGLGTSARQPNTAARGISSLRDRGGRRTQPYPSRGRPSRGPDNNY